MSPNTQAHEAPGAPLGHLMRTQCGAHECSQRKRGPMSTGVAHECSRKKMGFADVYRFPTSRPECMNLLLR